MAQAGPSDAVSPDFAATASAKPPTSREDPLPEPPAAGTTGKVDVSDTNEPRGVPGRRPPRFTSNGAAFTGRLTEPSD